MIYRAYWETTNFTFEALGQTRERALMVLHEGWLAHAKQYQVRHPQDYWQDALGGDIQVEEMELGCAYRDRELLVRLT